MSGVQLDIDTVKQIGEMHADMRAVKDRLTTVEQKLDGVVAMTNRWKGATTILIFLGGLIGWGTNFLLKLTGKA